MNLRALFAPKKDNLFECLPCATLILETDGKIIDANERAIELFETTRFALVGEFVSKFIEGGSNFLNSVLNAESPSVAHLVTSEKYAQIVASKDDDSPYVYVCLSDITKSHIAQTKINENYKVLKDINDEKNTFLTANSNEILSYASSAESFSRALLNNVAGAMMSKQEKYVQIINKNSKELLYDLEKLFELFKLESDLWKFSYRTFDIVNLLNDISRKWADNFKVKKIRFEYDFSNISTRTCYLDSAIIELIVDSLLELSYKNMEVGSCTLNAGNPPELFMEDKKAVLGEGANPKSYILFELKDSSIALSEEELANIFNPYKIIKNPQRRSIGSRCIYSIVKKLLLALGGDIWVYSKPSSGTMISFIIPVERMIQKI